MKLQSIKKTYYFFIHLFFFILIREIGSNKGLVIGPGAGVPKHSNGSLS